MVSKRKPKFTFPKEYTKEKMLEKREKEGEAESRLGGQDDENDKKKAKQARLAQTSVKGASMFLESSKVDSCRTESFRNGNSMSAGNCFSKL